MLTDNAMKFFVFSYFGATYDELKDDRTKAILVCANRAYLDLNRTLTFKKETNDKETDEAKKNFRAKICKIIRKNVEELLDDKKEFEAFHSATCEKIIDSANDTKILEGTFTYGQAQKWLNMTLKYLYILGFLKDEIVSQLHVPIDSYILKAVSKAGISIPKSHEYGKSPVSFGPYKESGNDKSQPWSKFNEEDYKAVQRKLRDEIKGKSPIEWEGHAWIEIAKKQNDK